MPSACFQIEGGMPVASSKMIMMYLAWNPWNEEDPPCPSPSVAASALEVKPMANQSSPSFHSV